MNPIESNIPSGEVPKEIQKDKKQIEQERTPEKLPTVEEILEEMGLKAEECKVTEKSDKNGVYQLEARVEGENGEYKVYDYARRGEFDTHRSSGTSIHIAEYDKDGGFNRYPEHIAEYNHETGGWQKV